MSDIFLSYAKEDRPKVRRLARSLEQLGWTVFWDPEIPAGQTWREVIDTEIKSARCVVVTWSRRSVGSHWVLEEAEIGRQRHVLIPILIDGVLPPLGFQSLQAADLSDWEGTVTAPSFARLVSSIAGILGSPPKRKSKLKVEEKPPLGVGAIVVVALAALQIAFWGGYSSTLLELTRTGEMNILLSLFVTLSAVLLPLVGGVLVVVKSRAATYVFGVAAFCDLVLLFPSYLGPVF